MTMAARQPANVTVDVLPAPSPAEMEALLVIWQLGQATVRGVQRHLAPKRRIAYAKEQRSKGEGGQRGQATMALS